MNLRKTKLLFNPLCLGNLGCLFLFWLLAALVDRVWFALDQAPPAWDPSDHLTRAMNYWRVLQHCDLFSGAWWTELWQLSPSHRAPFVYLLTAPFLAIFGWGADQAALVNLLFTAIILVCTYHLGKLLFNAQVGLWAAGLCLLAPSFLYIRTDYLLDYGLTAVVTFTFLCVTAWRQTTLSLQRWLWSVGAGVGLGLLLLTRPTGVIFLVGPGLWILGSVLLPRVVPTQRSPQKKQWVFQWQAMLQLTIALAIALLICGPWYRTNWLTILTSTAQSNLNGSLYENEAGPNTIAGWLAYAQLLPFMVSPFLLWGALGCWGVWLGQRFRGSSASLSNPEAKQPWLWLAAFCGGTYILCSLGSNRDPRFILPYLPVVLLVLARGLTWSSQRWLKGVRWGTVALTLVWGLWNLFPLPGAAKLGGQHLAYLGPAYPHEAVIAAIIQDQPYLRSNVGLVANTPQINPFNIDLQGAIANFQVYGRQLGFTPEQATQDARSLNWYLTKTGDQGAYNGIEKGQAALRTQIEQSPELAIYSTWNLPDGSELRLHRRRQPPVTVTPLTESPSQVQLQRITVPKQTAPGQPVPVTYQLAGNWQQLQSGLLVLTWVNAANPQQFWLHDHGIGLGQLYAGAQTLDATQGFQVIENLAMLPPASLPPGTYTLQATYLDRNTGASYPLTTPSTTLTLNPKSPTLAAPELDLPTQLRQLATGLPTGKIDPVFQQVTRLNQYDPLQDYLLQTIKALNYRLSQNPQNLEWVYNLAIAHVLRQDAPAAIETLRQATQLDPQNPYPWTYLGFVYLYNWQPHLAQEVLDRAATLSPTVPELKTLRGIAALLQLQIPQAWQLLH